MGDENAEKKMGNLMNRIIHVSDASMHRKRNNINHRPSLHWLNDEFRALRKQYPKTRRAFQRKKNNSAELFSEYKAARRKFNTAIEYSKRNCWIELIQEVERETYGVIPIKSSRPP